MEPRLQTAVSSGDVLRVGNDTKIVDIDVADTDNAVEGDDEQEDMEAKKQTRKKH